MAGQVGTRAAELAAYSPRSKLKREQSLASCFSRAERKLSRNLKYMVRMRIPEFESYVASQPVRLQRLMNEIAFPMPRHCTVGDFCWALADHELG